MCTCAFFTKQNVLKADLRYCKRLIFADLFFVLCFFSFSFMKSIGKSMMSTSTRLLFGHTDHQLQLSQSSTCY